VDDFKYTVRGDEPCPGEPAVKCHVVEAVPATDAVKERTGYAKSVTWVGQDNFMVRRAEYADLEGQPWKRLEASDIREVDPKAGKWMAHRIRVENLKNGRFTVLRFADVKVSSGIPDSTFTPQNLSRPR
jgi:outer membrane lipoprotein-sorting protein